MPIVSGHSAPHDVPIHFIAADAAILSAIDQWHWTEGMAPDASSPNWPMDTVRERLLSAFTPPDKNDADAK